MLDKFKIGHCSDENIGTGVSVILCEDGAVGGVSVRGAAPGTRETDLLKPENTVDKVNAVVLSGGSAFGLASSCGVMEYLREKNIGFDAGSVRVPIVCGAVIFDLEYRSFGYPSADMGYKACVNALAENWASGNVGAGCGATVGKLLGIDNSSKGGVGIALASLGGLEIGVMSVVNAFGDIYDYKKGEIIAGAKIDDSYINILDSMMTMLEKYECNVGANTTISCVFTNAKLTKAQANKVADIAHDGYALTIRPCHTSLDGDTVFCLASGEVDTEMLILEAIVPSLTADAIMMAVKHD